MPRVDTDRLTPAERNELIKSLTEDQKSFQEKNLVKIKKEFEALAAERGLTLGQIFLAGVRRGGPRGPRKKTQQSGGNQEF
jgi:hypothetical protein